ncbi:MAG: histidine kinase [Candidatus Marinimicrobia bacterium]|jgi:UPF0271 protein|nr:histidine kinase [Candidatus Neomarinimicrobiota bacterium]MDP6276068.1 5-oxoprolinase subunit PxpA [Candidatus Neomarinimicrobiota bacterium]
MKPIIDINSDMGEIQKLLDDGTYAAMLPYVTSINIACGGHAGDDDMMADMVLLANEHGVNIGAHPSYPDREHFGRRAMVMTSAEIAETVAEQILRLQNIADKNGCALTHVKPHGALYNTAVHDAGVAAAIGEGVQSFNEHLPLVGLADANMLTIWKKMGLESIVEGFADRTYESDGSLRSREFDDALITDPEKAAQQAVNLAKNETFSAADGTELNISANTICIHSDTPHAVEISKTVYSALSA